MSTSTLIICENRIVAECLAKVLELSSVSSTFARNREEAFDELGSGPSDVILLDHAGWREETVLDFIAEIRREHEEARVLVMNGPDGEQSMMRYIEGGAAGFLSKHHTVRELIDAIDCVVQHAAKCSADQVASIFARLQELSQAHGHSPDANRHPLTFREVDVLRLIDMGRSNKEIAAELHVSVHTVKSHVHHILEKAGATNRREAVYVALQNGWLDSPSKE